MRPSLLASAARRRPVIRDSSDSSDTIPLESGFAHSGSSIVNVSNVAIRAILLGVFR
jgi:hypothetical protein